MSSEYMAIQAICCPYGLCQVCFAVFSSAHLELFAKNCQGQRLVGNFQITAKDVSVLPCIQLTATWAEYLTKYIQYITKYITFISVIHSDYLEEEIQNLTSLLFWVIHQQLWRCLKTQTWQIVLLETNNKESICFCYDFTSLLIKVLHIAHSESFRYGYHSEQHTNKSNLHVQLQRILHHICHYILWFISVTCTDEWITVHDLHEQLQILSTNWSTIVLQRN